MARANIYVEELEIEIDLKAQAKLIEDAVMARFDEVKDKLIAQTMESIESIALRNIERRVDMVISRSVVDYVQKHINEELERQFKKGQQ